jgi:Zinc-binding loop region of homing endonuclease
MSSTTVTKPKQRTMDDDAVAALRSIIIKCKPDVHIDQRDPCWLWPDEWPESWGDKPSGYLICRDDEGYGLFIILQNYKGDQFTPTLAHRLCFEHIIRDPIAFRLVIPEELQSLQSLQGGEKFEPEHVAPLEAFLVRHLCANKSCVNPNHLVLGDESLNGLDASLQCKKDQPIGKKAESKRQDIITSFKSELSIREIAAQVGYDRIYQWEIAVILMEAKLLTNEMLANMRTSTKRSKEEIEQDKEVAAFRSKELDN